ncbi:MAG: imidazole glycerol phosphate synthase subunit HisH [Chloroflexi bacterium]|nr:MAG: imidazole glycerol phosphate synthase subunit HisH [Chloroflexota bacterium]MBL1192897.1 imidazole glycerol phosphate synthase subunit HisH [Chloroflexota bacterium]NOH10189.1 imidazole glycerol phosphate synthase subunit HisH [Chloroflexota bacterium]
MITIIDYGVGNLRSVHKAFRAVGAEAMISSSKEDILKADKVVLPGVGSFGDGMAGLQERELVEPVKAMIAQGKPFLGICVGMQLLFESSDELGQHKGLGVLPGTVTRFKDVNLKVPQTGWNQLQVQTDNPLCADIDPNSYAYFNHAYYCAASNEDDVIMATDYGGLYASAVGRDKLYAVQFHPEKSQAIGLQILRNFVERC